ncbi:GA module-containing protein, partial [Streptococcus suis]|uniref:Rib/alpha-like domain-containing protein n=2 Tax=Streptococcus suis TaxID=1307 RepID=UPI001C97EDDF
MFKIKRNKLNRQEAFNFEKRSRFGIRKLTIGVVSLAIGSGMVLNAAEQVYAGTDFDSGEIRHVRNGSPKEMAEGSAVPGTIAEKANYRDYKIETVPVVENGVQYVDVTLTFNERGRAYSKNRFYVFNMPSSLYEPKVITREVYQQAVQESQSSVGSQTYTDYKIVASQKISTLTTSGWREEPTNVAPGTDRWGVNYRYINGNPESSDYNKGNNTMRQIIGPGNNNSGEAISWIYTSKGAYDGDWDRLISHSFDGKAEVVNNFKNKSNSIYIEQARHSREKVVYKFRARVKDPNADMNFIFGMNEMIANGHANFLAKYGKTPDNRKYSERFSVNTPAKITVDNTSNLTRDNKLAIIAKIKEANSSLFGSDNSLKTPILVEPTENDIPTNATSGNITLRYTDGSTTTIPVANTVRQKVVATNNPAPRVVTALTYDAAKNSATKTENGQRTRIQLPDKLGVTDLGQIANPTAKIDPVNSATTAENLWNAQLNALRAKNLGTGGTFATNTYINNIGSASDPTENNGLYDMSATSRFALSLKKSSTGQIEGILVKGPNADNNAQVDVGLITADMLFKNVSSIEPARQSARQEIDNLGNIDGKDGWKNEINNAGTEAEIQAVVDKAKRAKAEFDKKKDAVKAKIDALTTLTPEQKEQFKQRVDNTTQSHMLEVPYEDAKKAGLAKEKEQAIALINSLEHLPATGSPSKQESIEWINDPWIVPDSATLNNEVTDALINNAKIKAKKELDAMNPAPSNLAELKRQIDAVTKESAKAQGKTGQEIIEAIVEKAKTDALKEQAKKDIAAVPGLSAEKKKEYQDKVDAATNVRDLEQIVSEAKAHAEYETAKQTIQGLPNLNNAQKEALLASLDDDKTQAGIAATLDEARQQDSDMARLKELQDQAEQLKNSSAYRDGQPDKKKALDDALNASKLITPSNGQRPTVDLGQMIKNLEDGIKGLGSDPVARTVDKSSLNAEIQRDSSVKAQNNYSYQFATESKKQAYETALQEAQNVANNQQATQDQVNAATDKLRNARLALDGHAPDRVQDTTPPVLEGDKMTAYSDVSVHGVSTVGRKVPRPNQSTTVDEYGENSTSLVELILKDDESDIDINSITFEEASLAQLRSVGLQFVKYDSQKENGAVGYFTTIEENGIVKFTGSGNLKLYFTVANSDGATSQRLEYRYTLKDDIAPTATPTEHVLIRGQEATVSIPIEDNSLFGTGGGVSTGTMSIRPANNTTDPLTPTILNFTNGNSPQAFTISIPENSPEFMFGSENYGKRSHTGTVSLVANPSQTLERTTYKFRLADGNKPHTTAEKVSFTDITFTVVDRLVAPEESAKVSVNNPSRLTEDEKNAIKQAVRTANPHIAAIDGNAGGVADKQVKIDVANDGRVTVTYPHGGKQDTLTADQVLRVNQAPVADVNNFGPMRNIPGNAIPDGGTRNRPTVFVFAKQAISNDGRATKTRQELEAANMGYLPITDPDNDALKEVAVTNFEGAPLGSGLKVASNGTLSGSAFTTVSPGGGWVARIVPKDAHDKLGNPVYFHIRAYTDKLIDPTQANPVEGTYNQAVTAEKIFEKLTIDAPIGNSSITVPDGSNPDEKAQYTRTITGYKTTENGEVTTVDNGVAGLPKQGTYFAEVTTTNIWGQTIKNYVKVVHQEDLAARTDLVAPEAVQVKGTTVAEDEKQTIIDALKAANPGKLPDDPSSYSVAPNGTVTVTYSDNSSEPIDVPLKSGIPTVTAQPHDIVVFKNTDMTTPVELAGFTDNESIKDIQIVGTDGSSLDQMGLTVDEKAKENNVKSALISGKTNSAVGKHTRKLRALDNLDQASAATNDFSVRIVDATVNQPETAITKEFGQALTPEEVRSTINFNVGSGQNNLIDFDVVIPADAPTSGKNVEVPVIIRTKAHASASEEFKRTFVSQDKTVTVRATWPTQADNIEVTAPADTTPVLIDGARPTSEADKTALINALKEANKTPEGTSKFPENTRFDVAENGAVTITYPDNSSETVTVPFKQKDSAQHTPTVAETPINSAATAGTPLTEDERNAVKAAVTVPNFPAGDKQPTITVPDNASVTNGTNGNTGKPVVVATVEYPDGTTEQVEVPVRQRDTAKYEATISNPEAPAAIKASHASDTAITDEADKNAILAKVSVPEGSSGRPSLDQNPVVEERDGKQVVKVTVTYPDQTTDTVYVPVDQKDNETHNPTAPAESVKLDAPATANSTLSDDDKAAVKAAVTVPDGSRGEVSLPEGAKVELVGDKPVVKATVTYPDGTTDIVDVPVVQKDSTKYDATASTTPVPLDSPVTPGQTLSAEEREALKFGVNVPAGSNGQIHVPENAAVKLDGDKPVVEAEVRYPDGTVDKVQVPVRQYDRAVYTPNLVNSKEVPISVDPAGNPSITSQDDTNAILANVDVPAATPDGTKPEVTKTIASPVKDGTGTNQGKKVVEVEITYPDKSKEKIEVPVKHADNQVHNPEAPTKPVQLDVAATTDTSLSDADKQAVKDAVTIPQGSGGVASLPEDAKVVDRNGTPVVPVTVTYPDGTTETVDVPVVQKDSTKHTPVLTEANSPVLTDTPAKANEPVQEEDKAAIAAKVDKTNLPQGTETKVPDDAVVELENGKPVVPVLVSYPDGTSETINVPVKQADNLAMDPSLKDTNPVPILTEATVGLTVSDKANLDAIVAKVDPKTGKAEVVNNTIVAGKEDGPHAGQPVVNVLVTYPDGTQDTIEVPVKQADNVVKEPSLTDQTPVPIQAAATTGTLVPADDKPAILAKVKVPEGAEATIADDATVVREDGQPVVPVTVTYPDGTQDTISVPVKRADNSKYTPSQVMDTVQVDAATAPGTAITSQDDKDAIIAAVTVPKVAAGEKAPVVSLPENPQVEVVNAQPVVKAIVTYADGTTDTVDVPIVQKVSATKEPSLKETEPGKPAQAVITENPTAGASITDPADQNVILDKVVVPEGGKASIADDAVVEMDGDQPVLPVTVTYTDGSKDIIKVPVKQADNVAKEPSLKSQTPVGVMDAPAVGAQVEEPADLEAIKNNVDTKGGTASIEDPTIVEGPNNQPAVAVKVTYPDGTADTILVPIKTADNVTYTPVLKSTDPVLVSVATDNGTAVPEADQAKILANVDVPALTADGDKPAVDLSIENPVVLQKNGQAGVEVTVTYQDGSKDKIFVPVDTDTDKDGFSNKEEEKAGTSATDPASTPAGQDSAERLNPGLTEPVEVKNPDKLTDAEKEAVKKAVEDSNDLPAGTTVSVANDGTVTVTYPDNSTDTIKPKDAVTQFVDTDGDGISDRQETENGTDPSKVDSDNDGFSDKEEVERGTDPTKADSKPASSETDTDGDGISNEDEVARGTDPNKSDTDGDGFSDQEEITAGSNPTKADSTPANVDKDGDGFTDTEEAAAGTDANNPASTPAGQDSADRLNPGLTEPVEVKNPDKLTDAEKESVKKAVEDSNDLPEGTEVTVSDNGTVTVTYPDKSTDTIQPAETVKVAKDTDKDGFTDTEEAAAGTDANNPASTPAGQDSADRLNPGLTEPVEVKNPDKLTDAEKESVKKAVEDSNDLPEGTEVTVSDNGTVTVTYPDKSTDTIQPAETVKVAKDTDKDGFTDTEEATAGTDATNPASTPAGQDSAGQLTPSLAEPVEVKNPDKLTDAEKESVKKAVEDSNDLPEGTEVTVSDNGTVTVTYPDKSTDTIQPAE